MLLRNVQDWNPAGCFSGPAVARGHR